MRGNSKYATVCLVQEVQIREGGSELSHVYGLFCGTHQRVCVGDTPEGNALRQVGYFNCLVFLFSWETSMLGRRFHDRACSSVSSSNAP